MNHLYDALAAGIADPGKVAIIRPNGQLVSYADLFGLAGRLAGALTDRGVKPDDRVAVQVEKSWQSLALYLATLRVGAVYLPLNPAYVLSELQYFLADAEPKLLVCRPDWLSEVAPLAERFNRLAMATLGSDGDGTLLTELGDVVPTIVPRGPEDLAAILYTSGTTGRSKGAMLSHDNLLSNAYALVAAWRFTDRDVLLHALPIYHTHGLFVACHVALLAGSTMIFCPRFDAEECLRLMPQATTMMGVPTYYVRLLEHKDLDRQARHMRLFVSGSAPLLPETHASFFARTGHKILERYGMTETNMNTSNPYSGERISGTVGQPLPGVELRVTEPESGQPLAQGEIGVIEVKGPNVFKGYWRQPDKTKAEFRPDGFFITGDLGSIDRDGYVRIVGRAKDLVISGGLNVYPKEVELEIDALDGVKESAVIGLPHPDLGEAVTAIVVPAKGSSLSEADVLGLLAGRLANFKRPKRVFFVDELPRNAMGKVQKNLLREAHARTYARDVA